MNPIINANILHITPGSSLIMKPGDKEVKPFMVYYNIANWVLKPDKWAERCHELEIAGIDLGSVLYM